MLSLCLLAYGFWLHWQFAHSSFFFAPSVCVNVYVSSLCVKCRCEMCLASTLFFESILFGGYRKNVTFSLYETMHLIRFLIRIRLIPVFFKWLQLLLTKRTIKCCTVLCACIQNRHSVTARNDAVSIWICSQRRISIIFLLLFVCIWDSKHKFSSIHMLHDGIRILYNEYPHLSFHSLLFVCSSIAYSVVWIGNIVQPFEQFTLFTKVNAKIPKIYNDQKKIVLV